LTIILTEFIRKQVLMQTEKEYKEMDKQMKKDIGSGLALDPIDTNILTQKSLENDAYAPEIQDAEAEAENERKIELEKSKPKPSPKAPSNKGSNK